MDLEKLDCLECGKPCSLQYMHYFICPSHLFVSNCYLLCEEHKHKRFVYEDIYDQDGSQKNGFKYG